MKNGQKLNVGIIGAGFIGEEHIEAVNRTFIGNVAAIAENDLVKAKIKAEKMGISKYYDDYQLLLKDEAIDVVHICTPNSCHFEMTEKALKANKHVICEKPLTLTVNEAKKILDLAKKMNRVHAIHFNIRYYPLIRHAKACVDRGDIGKINVITGSYLQDWLFYETDYSWRLESEQSGNTRAIGDIGTHWMDLVEYVSGCQITEVMADMETIHKTRKKPKSSIESWSGKLVKAMEYDEVLIDTEDYATVLLNFDNGAKGCYTVNQMAAGRKNRVYFEINGSKASLVWDSETPNELIIGKRDEGNEMIIRDPSLVYPEARQIIALPGGHNEGFADTSKQLFKEVYTYIIEGDYRKPKKFPDFKEGFREVQLCDAIFNSGQLRQWVKVT